MRGFSGVRQAAKPLTLTLSQRERGYERMAKQVPCVYTGQRSPREPRRVTGPEGAAERHDCGTPSPARGRPH
jgi:hypothetical protein